MHVLALSSPCVDLLCFVLTCCVLVFSPLLSLSSSPLVSSLLFSFGLPLNLHLVDLGVFPPWAPLSLRSFVTLASALSLFTFSFLIALYWLRTGILREPPQQRPFPSAAI